MPHVAAGRSPNVPADSRRKEARRKVA